MRNTLVLKKGMQIWNRDGYLDILVSFNGNLVLCDMMELDDDGNLLFAGQEWLDPRDLKTDHQIETGKAWTGVRWEEEEKEEEDEENEE